MCQPFWFHHWLGTVITMLKRLASIASVVLLTGLVAACGNNNNSTNVGSVGVD